MHILLFGKDGQVGHALQRTLLPLGSLTALGRRQADLENPDALQGILQQHRPDVIVNAAAYTAVDQAEGEPQRAHTINAAAVAQMATYARDHNALLVHYSTDYVFDGAQEQPYRETDAPNPINVYGRSKLAGEAAIAASGCRHLILRTSWVFSAHGDNFVKTILQLARASAQLSIVADQIGAPTSNELIADVTALALAALHREALASGLYHLTAAGQTSWHGLACHVIAHPQARGLRLALTPAQIHAIATADSPQPARRPANSRLNTDKISQALGLELPDWTLHTDRCVSQLIGVWR